MSDRTYIAIDQSRSTHRCIRNAISIGGDSDTIGCFSGAIAEALFGIPNTIRAKGKSYLPNLLLKVVEDFEQKNGCKLLKVVLTKY